MVVSLVLGQCTKSLQERLKLHRDFERVHKDRIQCPNYKSQNGKQEQNISEGLKNNNSTGQSKPKGGNRGNSI